MYTRTLSEDLAKSKKSVLLIGPRQTGKSTLIRFLHPDLTINLAHEETFLQFAQDPQQLEKRIKGKKTIFIDEIQKLPRLTNTIQVLIDENKSLKFYLSGSSVRKLKRGKVNLLPGRVISYSLGPLNFTEIGNGFNLEKALSLGTLPGIYSEQDQKLNKQLLTQYAASYLKEEIAAEGFVKNIESFARFLRFAAVSAAQIVDISKTSQQAYVSRASAGRFFEIMEETLIIQKLPAFSANTRSRLIKHPKFYFFDCGVWNGLLKNFIASDDRKGALFESFIFNQIQTILNYKGNPFELSFFRTEHDTEVDFILEKENTLTAIEVKASRNVGPQDLKGIKSFKNVVGKKVKSYVLYLGDHKKVIEGVEVLPWMEGLDEIL